MENTIETIKREGYDEIHAIADKYREKLKKHLAEMKLDGDVERISDGKRGRLIIDYGYTSSNIGTVKFYAYNKNGELNKRSTDAFEWHIEKEFREFKGDK